MTRFICKRCGGDIEIEATRVGGDIRVGCPKCLPKLETLTAIIPKMREAVELVSADA